MLLNLRIKRRLELFCVVLILLTSNQYGQENRNARPLFRAKVETVFVKVAVTDDRNRQVNGLAKNDFKIYEDKLEQQISHFTSEAAPVSVGIIYDLSGSLERDQNIRVNKNSFVKRLRVLNPGDEFFLMTVNDTANLVEPFTSTAIDLQKYRAAMKPGKSTALLDAIYMGLEKVKEGANEKKALIVFSDGGENGSRYGFREVLEAIKESDVPIYAVAPGRMPAYRLGVLVDIVKTSGGKIFCYCTDDFMNQILAELRHQYLLGYVSTNKTQNGKWRKIRVQLNYPSGNLKIRAKEGYYASK